MCTATLVDCLSCGDLGAILVDFCPRWGENSIVRSADRGGYANRPRFGVCPYETSASGSCTRGQGVRRQGNEQESNRWDYSTTRPSTNAKHEEGGGFSAHVANLPGAVSQGETQDDALANLREAFAGVIETYREMQMEIPWSEKDL